MKRALLFVRYNPLTTGAGVLLGLLVAIGTLAQAGLWP